jgi:hypothetical protein
MVQLTWRWGSEHHHVYFLLSGSRCHDAKHMKVLLLLLAFSRDRLGLFVCFKSKMCDVRLSGVGFKLGFGYSALLGVFCTVVVD